MTAIVYILVLIWLAFLVYSFHYTLRLDWLEAVGYSLMLMGVVIGIAGVLLWLGNWLTDPAFHFRAFSIRGF